ncbi:DUF4352 domain-containing protein [Streptomyces californicus]|uniref:DUF4352 domain-containing protein n=1 Tax=Streptomyces californicus TaxID=67351 RepID=UPI00296FB87B|nr:DUF4352 domain-containing protein [Streptomyces californicus]MDW4900649.1 DUF4352 domain-containing protein [Streptomyces californicus]
MRRTTITTLAVTAALLFTATACTDDDITTKPSKTGAAEQPADSEPAEAPEDEPTKATVAKVGDTITLKGQEDGSKVDATLKKVVDPAQPKDEFFAPEDGNRWIAAQFELTNTGTKPYADSPSNGAGVADADGQRFSATFADTKAGPSMTSSAKVPPGEKVLGWITFEVPKGSKIVTVQFGLDSGFAEQTGQWKLS